MPSISSKPVPAGPALAEVTISEEGLKIHGKVEEMTVICETPAEAPEIVRDGLEVVERLMKKYRAVALPGLPRFTGGAVGFIGYEFIHDVEPVVPRPLPKRHRLSTIRSRRTRLPMPWPPRQQRGLKSTHPHQL